MKLIDVKWNTVQQKWENTWLADDASGLSAGFDPESAIGSQILVISTGEGYIKNSQGKWQKLGSTEVLA